MSELPSIGFITKLSDNARRILTSFGEFKDYDAGSEIIKQDEIHPYMYLLLEGTCEVYYRGFKGDVIASQLSPGASFGEFSMLFEQRASAAVRTNSPARIWRINEKQWQIYTSECPGAALMIMKDILRLVGDRLRNAGQMIVGNTVIQEKKA